MRAHRVPLRRSGRQSSKKQNLKYIIIIVLLVIFFATIGVKLVIKTSLFVSGISKDSGTPTQSEDDAYILTPELYDLPDATNSAQLKIFGSVAQDLDVTVYVNDEEVNTFTADSDEFEDLVTLKRGENTLYLEIEDPESKKVKSSDIYKVLYLHEKPSLTINSPADNQTVSTQEVTIDGKTDQSVAVRIQGSPVVVSVDGSFKHVLRLKEGENKVVIEATDIAGNQERIEMTLVYDRDE